MLGSRRLKLQLSAVLLITMLVLNVGSYDSRVEASVFGQSKVDLVINGAPMIAEPGAVVFNGRTYLPVRALGHTLGVTISWDDETHSVLINSDKSRITTALFRGGEYGGCPIVNVVVNNKALTGLPPSVAYNGATYVPLRLVEALGLKVGWDAEKETAYVGEYNPDALPIVGTLQNLEALMTAQEMYLYRGKVTMDSTAGQPESTPPPAAAPSPSPDGAPKGEYSETNIQVAGVDESDIVKTDGKYIYHVRGNVVTVYNAYPVEQLSVLTTLTFSDESFYPSELYIDDDHMVVIGRGENAIPQPEFDPDKDIIKRPIGESAPDAPRMMPIWPGYYWNQSTAKAVIFDISNMDNIEQIREVEIEGDILTSRKIGSNLFLLSNKYQYGFPIILPMVRDSAKAEDFAPIDLNAVRYFPGQPASSYLLIASLDLAKRDSGSVVEAYLGAGQNVYMSHDNLYVAVPNYNSGREETMVYRFAIDGIDVSYKARGEVSGNILNQFSMDDYKEHFRIATTIWGEKGLSNSVYVLDREMKTVGKIEGIAPNERIFSARFMGDKGYLVTFELIDPLFVLDLSEPTNPQILGALKIPGFSNYLHPLDDNHLLGIGRDTDIGQHKDHTGRVISEFTIEKGIKLAIFDVRDVSNPIERHVEIIGGRGTQSEMLHNHKALLYDQRNDTLALPVSIYREDNTNMSWGTFEYQGAVFYDVNLEDGFARRGEVTHISKEDYLKSGNHYWYGNENEVRRVLYIGDHFYVISQNMITAHNVSNLKETARVEVK